jgi:ABC-type branched-subunit amino acid transport system ATPase component
MASRVSRRQRDSDMTGDPHLFEDGFRAQARYLLIDQPSAGVAAVVTKGVYATPRTLRGDGSVSAWCSSTRTAGAALQVADDVAVIDLDATD